MKRPSIYDIAKQVDVSPSTVSRVLNDDPRISEETKQKVRKELKRIKYIPNSFARNLNTKVNKNIGVFYNGKSNEIITPYVINEKLTGICKEANLHGYNILLFYSDCLPESKGIWDIIVDNNLCGIITIDSIHKSLNKRIYEYDIPHIQVNWFNSDVDGNIQSLVLNDTDEGFRMAFKHLYQKGYREVEILDAWNNDFLLAGVKQCLVKFQKKHHDFQLKITNFSPTRHDKENFVSYIKSNTSKVYICLYFKHAIWLLDYVREKNIKIPEDMAFLICDYVRLFEIYRPKITGISLSFEEMGKKAMEQLIASLEKSERKIIYISPTFIEGETT